MSRFSEHALGEEYCYKNTIVERQRHLESRPIPDITRPPIGDMPDYSGVHRKVNELDDENRGDHLNDNMFRFVELSF